MVCSVAALSESPVATLPLQVTNLSLRFGIIEVLRDVSFSVPPDSIFAIVGPNGAGKTSLLNVVSGAYQSTSGTLSYFGVEIRDQRPHDLARLGIARSFQNVALFDDLDVLENVLIGRHIHMSAGLLSCGLSWPTARGEERRHRAAAEEAIRFLDLAAVRHQPVTSLPYGVKKKVELARALAMQPRILLLDEPLAGMNVQEKREIVDAIAAIRARHGLTVMMIEHDFSLVMSVADHVLVLDHGVKIAEGPPRDIRHNETVIRAYFGEPKASAH